jgi:hypothetical protein
MSHMTVEQYRKLQKESQGKLNRLEKNHSGSKMNNKGQYYNGQYYHSTGEMNHAQQLDLLKKAGDIRDWKRQVKIDLKVKGVHIANYFMDFVVENNNGSIELIEYKGMETLLWKMKWNLLHALKDELFPPGTIITLVKHQSKYKPKKTWRSQAKK